MEIEIKRNKSLIHVDFGPDVSFEQGLQAVKDLYGLMNDVAPRDNIPLVNVGVGESVVEKLNRLENNVKPETERIPGMRDRLPNNAVDISELDVKQATTENALVRCPHCGQSHAIILKDGKRLYCMRRNYDQNQYEIIAESDNPSDLDEMVCKGNALEYFQTLQDASVINSDDFAVTNDTEIFCPMCKQSASFESWKTAWEYPLRFFEYEHPCDCCGGETVEVMKKSSNETVLICESCGKGRDDI